MARQADARAKAGGLWLASLAWTLPLEKLVLHAGLALGHGQSLTSADLLSLLPEATAAAAIGLAVRLTARRRVLQATVALLALLLVVGSWLAIGSWAFAGAPVGLPLLRRLLLDPTIWRTALGDPALRPALLGWLSGLLVVWGAAAIVALVVRQAVGRVRTSILALASCMLAALTLLGQHEGDRPERRLALAVALGAESANAVAATDPVAYMELAPPLRRPPRAAADPTQPRNVLIVVLESVRLQQGSLFDAGFPNAIHFDRAYAHHPRSVKTLEALLFGIYPSPELLSAAWAIDHYDVEKIGALPRLLAAHGLATHYFSAMSLGFDNYGGALEAAGFDEIEVATGDEMLTWGVAAPALFDRVAMTLESGHARGERQLVMAWTAECHAPYDHAGELAPAEDRRERYLACQTALAGNVDTLLARLARSGVLEETLVVVLGDHGQIFASEKPGDFGHGTHVYEPSLRVPLLFFVSGRKGRRDARLFQLVDVPATIASLLGLAIPDAWVGRDMLDESDPGRSFVVALSVLSDGQAAVVDASGDKLVRSPGSADLTQFDLSRDPTEERGAVPSAATRALGEARIATYERVAASGWESRRLTEVDARNEADGAEIAALWAPGPCIATRLDARGDLRVEPATGPRCGKTGDAFERRLVRALGAPPLAKGFELRLMLELDESVRTVDRELRTLVKLWGSEQVHSAVLDRQAEGFQTIRVSLPGPPAASASGDTVLAVVPVDPPTPYTLRTLEVTPSNSQP